MGFEVIVSKEKSWIKNIDMTPKKLRWRKVSDIETILTQDYYYLIQDDNYIDPLRFVPMRYIGFTCKHFTDANPSYCLARIVKKRIG